MAEHPEPATEQTVAALTAALADLIAASRYEAWDSHAKGADPTPWGEYRDRVDPSTAHNIYITDGLRDAAAIMPLLRLVSNQTVVETLRDAADKLEADGAAATAVAWLRANANLKDWRLAPSSEEVAE